MAASGAEPWQTRVSPPRWQPSPRRQLFNATAVAAISLANIWHPPQISPVHTSFLHIPEGLRPGLVQPMCAWMDGWMNDLDGWIMGYGIPQGQSWVSLLRESTLPWLLSLGWCLRSEELWGVVLIHNFPISGYIPVYVAHLSGLGALSLVNGQLYITMHLFVYKKIYTVYYRNNAHSDIAR